METATLTFIGFGEAAQAFADGLSATAYDIKTAGADADAKHADYTRCGVAGASDPAAAVAGARLVLSLVTADQALAAADAVAPHIAPGALYCDMNSVSPDTKRAASARIEAAGGRYVDVAVMAPVHPARRTVPMLASGPHAEAAVAALTAASFTDVAAQAGPVGAASAIKMIRSVMVKGVEALSAECALAARKAGVLDAVIASLDRSWPGADWDRRIDYNLDRMIVHGLRRAAEMEESVKTLDALGTGSGMTRGTVDRQRSIGRLEMAPPAGLTAKLDALAQAMETA